MINIISQDSMSTTHPVRVKWHWFCCHPRLSSTYGCIVSSPPWACIVSVSQLRHEWHKIPPSRHASLHRSAFLCAMSPIKSFVPAFISSPWYLHLRNDVGECLGFKDESHFFLPCVRLGFLRKRLFFDLPHTSLFLLWCRCLCRVFFFDMTAMH